MTTPTNPKSDPIPRLVAKRTRSGLFATWLSSSKSSTNQHDASHTLPDELLLQIFREVLSDTHRIAEYLYWSPSFIDTFYGPGLLEHHGQATMRNAVLVCRTWNAVGTDILYSRPIIQSQKRLIQLAKTVSLSSYLAKLVHTIYVTTELTRFPSSTVKKPASFVASQATKKVMKVCRWTGERKMRKAPLAVDHPMSIVLRSCSSLETMVSTHDFQTNFFHRLSPASSSLQSVYGIGVNLRSLLLYGPMERHLPTRMPYGLPPDLHLPSLEVLSLREFFLFTKYPFPYLPSLHTLQLVICKQFPAGGPKTVIPYSQFPSLKCLDLCSTYFTIEVEAEICAQLEHLYLQGVYRLPILAGPTPSLKRAMMPVWYAGITELRPSSFFHKIMQGLEVLVLDMGCIPELSEVFLEIAARVVVEISSHPRFTLKQLVCLRSLRALQQKGEESEGSETAAHSKLKTACNFAGTELVVNPLNGTRPWITLSETSPRNYVF